MCMCVSLVSGSCVCGDPQRPEEGLGSPGAAVIGSYELPDVGAGNHFFLPGPLQAVLTAESFL